MVWRRERAFHVQPHRGLQNGVQITELSPGFAHPQKA
jgi:hypothetical protein